MANKVRLGDFVNYTSTDGFTKLALVIGTRKSVAKDTALARPEKGSAHLKVFSPTGQVYDRQSIPQGEGPGTFAPLKTAEAVQEDVLFA